MSPVEHLHRAQQAEVIRAAWVNAADRQAAEKMILAYAGLLDEYDEPASCASLAVASTAVLAHMLKALPDPHAGLAAVVSIISDLITDPPIGHG